MNMKEFKYKQWLEFIEFKYPGLLNKMHQFRNSYLAQEYKISCASVYQIRARAGIPKPPRHKTAEELEPKLLIKYPGIVEQLTIVPDADIAREYNVTREYVRQIRERYNKKNNSAFRRDIMMSLPKDKLIELIIHGNNITKLARSYHVSPPWLNKHLQQLFSRKDWESIRKQIIRNRWKSRIPDIEQQLPIKSNAQIGHETGYCATSINNVRKAFGIKSYLELRR